MIPHGFIISKTIVNLGLNPYYTGIHLHSFCFVRGWGNHFVLILIILEYIYIQPLAYLDSEATCLNPYYTGIHLHDVPMEEGKLYKFVLILIILEYIYIFISAAVLMNIIVLILIILEYIYIQILKHSKNPSYLS